MRKLSIEEHAMLELLALRPLSYIPPIHMSTMSQLSERGLTVRVNATWHPTGSALRIVGQYLH